MMIFPVRWSFVPPWSEVLDRHGDRVTIVCVTGSIAYARDGRQFTVDPQSYVPVCMASETDALATIFFTFPGAEIIGY